jgi:hypothetical protein
MYLISEHNIYTMNKDLKYIALQLCTCTWIEIMTGAGITLYLTYLHSYMLAVLTLAVFAPLIGFHFVMARLSKSEDYCSSSTYLRRFSDTQTEDLRHIHQFVSQRRGIDINDAKI